ncbi:oxygen-independent coproporphyrinogen-3 oxidase [Thermoflavifilum aggregans]|uniref:Heme chaperone HemW n=1 Tax=Thermoflavifilum aggregans TaxID=454188 RepID=A0A2M9CRG2_9BACT|nr:radical SAM family heme chaperone HemW [Thermoflavifilum aggregans]PJJ74477.1 oxygen-independent coproporphyrinogen-3 oxidase [Thermoflavifilum aggregans]
MAGFYLHIPFCRQACYYCNFHFSTSLAAMDEMVQAMQMEIQMHASAWNKHHFESLYFGGGTPSLLSEKHLHALLETIYANYDIDPLAEITLEANPDDMTPDKLRLWKLAGINRLSIGVQTLSNNLLRALHRSHDARQATASIQLALDAGFENISADLIYGIPGLTDAYWVDEIKQLLALQIPHLSCYALTIEPRTALDHLIRKQKFPQVDDEQIARQYLMLLDIMESAGYEPYEISSFARPGFRSRHNSKYWQGVPYLGIGPSAHSYQPPYRRWNIAHNAKYIQSIQQQQLPYEEECLTITMQYNEYVMLRLRTMEGVYVQEMGNLFGSGYVQYFQQQIQPWIHSHHVVCQEMHYVLSREGRLFADRIAASLFMTDEETQIKV